MADTVTLNANALLSKAELDLMLGITTASNDIAYTLINFASDLIENFCGRKFVLTTYTREAYSGNGFFRLYLKQYPIASVTAVELWDTANNVLLYTFTEHLEYEVLKTEGYIYMRGRWTRGGEGNFRVTYQAGHTTIPYDLKHACAEIAGLMYFNKGKAGIKSEDIGDYSVTFDKGGASFAGVALPDNIVTVLNLHKKVFLGDVVDTGRL